MTKWILRSRRKITGGLIVKRGKKKKAQRASNFIPARIGEGEVRKRTTKGGGTKRFTLSVASAHISAKGKTQKAKIISVADNPADSQLTRRNIVTKGAIINTDMGHARVTSRPGQDGIVNAVLVEQTQDAPAARKGKK